MEFYKSIFRKCNVMFVSKNKIKIKKPITNENYNITQHWLLLSFLIYAILFEINEMV